MKNSLIVGMIILFIIVVYFLHTKCDDKIQLKSFAEVATQKASLMSFMVLEEQKKTKYFKTYLKSTTFFDLRAINKYDDIKNSIDLKEYCAYIKDIQDEMYDFNATSKEIIKQICKDK